MVLIKIWFLVMCRLKAMMVNFGRKQLVALCQIFSGSSDDSDCCGWGPPQQWASRCPQEGEVVRFCSWEDVLKLFTCTFGSRMLHPVIKPSYCTVCFFFKGGSTALGWILVNTACDFPTPHPKIIMLWCPLCENAGKEAISRQPKKLNDSKLKGK